MKKVSDRVGKTQVFCSWASEISLSSLVSLNDNVCLINENLQLEAISKTARLVESMDYLGIQAYGTVKPHHTDTSLIRTVSYVATKSSYISSKNPL